MSPGRGSRDPLGAEGPVRRARRFARAAARPPLLLRRYAPRSSLANRVAIVERPRHPVIDAHNHLGGAFAGRWRTAPVAELLTLMDEVGIRAMVDLDGAWGEALDRELARFQAPHPDRFAVFAGIDYPNLETDPRFGQTEADRLRDSVARGARGLKIWKLLGLRARDWSGRRIAIDDERLGPMWEAAGELGVPVVIHVGDPAAFWQPADRHNERYEELVAHPDWQLAPRRGRSPAPALEQLVDELARVLERHRGTTFIGAHVGGLAEDLHHLAALLEAHPNLAVDTASRFNELGRQPFTTRDFLTRFHDRVLFGLDLPPEPAAYRIAYTFLETRAEYLPYSVDERPAQGRWRIYGVDLDDEVLADVYHRNAERLIFRPR
jgi:predicted TIM-barrel fold metal-dependent hydrolase